MGVFAELVEGVRKRLNTDISHFMRSDQPFNQ